MTHKNQGGSMQYTNIYSKIHFVQEALNILISSLNLKNQHWKTLSIFSFEDSWLTPQEFAMLKYCSSDIIVVLGNTSIDLFISVALSSKQIKFVNAKSSFKQLSHKIKDFIVEQCNRRAHHNKTIATRNKLNTNEYDILDLYMQGIPVEKISSILDLPVKSVYATKKNAMNKIGLKSDAALVNHWAIIRQSVDSLPSQLNKAAEAFGI
jgi:DNA-binding CsgD family transcriptional regulator